MMRLSAIQVPITLYYNINQCSSLHCDTKCVIFRERPGVLWIRWKSRIVNPNLHVKFGSVIQNTLTSFKCEDTRCKVIFEDSALTTPKMSAWCWKVEVCTLWVLFTYSCFSYGVLQNITVVFFLIFSSSYWQNLWKRLVDIQNCMYIPSFPTVWYRKQTHKPTNNV